MSRRAEFGSGAQHSVDRNILAEAWGKAFSDQQLPADVQVCTGGTHVVALLGGDTERPQYMLRWYREREDRRAELERLRMLTDQRPPVQIPHPLGEIDLECPSPFDCCAVMEPVRGKPLHQFLGEEQDATTHYRIGGELAALLKWVHSLPNTGEIPALTSQARNTIGHQRENRRRLQVAGLSTSQASSLLTDLVELWNDRSRFVPCHGDLYPQHILVDRETHLGVIDWDDMGLDDPMRDLAYWYEPVEGQLGQEAFPFVWQGLKKAYRPGFPDSDDERRLMLYALAGVLAYDFDPESQHVKEWLHRYGSEFGTK